MARAEREASIPDERKVGEVVPIRRVRRMFEGVDELDLSEKPALQVVEETRIAAEDLTGKPKVWLFVGDGGSGKTTEIRWMVGRTPDDRRAEMQLAPLDPGARALKTWFDGILEPPSSEVSHSARWLGDFCDDLVADPRPTRSVLFDFGGGGHVSLTTLLDTMGKGDLHRMLEDAGIGLVLCYTLKPRLDDLRTMDAIERAGFQPRATMILLNEGIADPSLPKEDAFEAVTRHSTYRNVVDRGGVPIWMPRLDSEVVQEIEIKRPMSFVQARSGKVPSKATFSPIGGRRRSMVARWLDKMEAAHKPVSTWLP